MSFNSRNYLNIFKVRETYKNPSSIGLACFPKAVQDQVETAFCLLIVASNVFIIYHKKSEETSWIFILSPESLELGATTWCESPKWLWGNNLIVSHLKKFVEMTSSAWRSWRFKNIVSLRLNSSLSSSFRNFLRYLYV